MTDSDPEPDFFQEIQQVLRIYYVVAQVVTTFLHSLGFSSALFDAMFSVKFGGATVVNYRPSVIVDW